MLPPITLLAVIYVLSPQIDWYYYNKFPTGLDHIQRQILVSGCPFYVALNAEKKNYF